MAANSKREFTETDTRPKPDAAGKGKKAEAAVGEGAAINEGTGQQEMDEARNVGGTPGAKRDDKGRGGQASPDLRGGKGEGDEQSQGPGKKKKQASQRNQEDLKERDEAKGGKKTGE